MDYNIVTYLYLDSGVGNVNRTVKSECYRMSYNTADIKHEAHTLYTSVRKDYDITGCNESVMQETLQQSSATRKLRSIFRTFHILYFA